MAANEPPFTLDQLLIVRAIAQHGSFRKAADSLFVSQPAVSLQIQNLERQLGVVLFDRGGRQVQLTEAGQVFVHYSHRILSLCQEVGHALSDLQEMKGGTLVLGASQTVGTYVMPLLIGQFRQTYPQIALQLLVQSTRRISQRLVSGEIDLAIVGGEIPFEMQTHLQIHPIAQDEFVLVSSASDPLSPSSGILPKSALLNLPFIMLDQQSSTRHTLDRALEKHGIRAAELQAQMELSSIEAIKTAVRAGLGVAFLSMTAVGFEIEQKTLRRIDVEDLQVKRTLQLAYKPDRFQSQASTIFRQGVLHQKGWIKQPLPYLESRILPNE